MEIRTAIGSDFSNFIISSAPASIRQDHLIVEQTSQAIHFQPEVFPLDGKFACSPLEALQRIAAHLPGSLMMNSPCQETNPAQNQLMSRYSFLTADPVEWFTVTDEEIRNRPRNLSPAQFLQRLDEQLRYHCTPALAGLPPFQGGWAGICSYELGHLFESLPQAKSRPVPIPAIQMGLYDFVIAWDHWQNKCWLISQGISETGHRHMNALERVSQLLSILKDKSGAGQPVPKAASKTGSAPTLELHPVASHESLFSNFTHQQYLDAVQSCIDLIHAGDAFQINLSQQLWARANCGSLELFQRLQACNAAPFSAWFDTGPTQIISASPERLFSVREGIIESRPIKGTRRRNTENELADKSIAEELLASAKDRAENTMIVDLVRNDLSRICHDDSVTVTQWCGLESFATVHHLVSAVQGRLREMVSPSQILQAIFPGGSVTGAPRIRAMEIIVELEAAARGAYCGSIGYFSLDGSADFNILIRTLTATDGWWQFPVGGGIVADSDPEQEYAETWTKAAGMLDAINGSNSSGGRQPQ